MHPIQGADELKTMLSPSASTQPCHCGLGACGGWESTTDDRWPSASMQLIATLRDPEIQEPTFAEHHPRGTRYDSPAAPVAVKFFPYNRCDLWRCNECRRSVLRYTEYGGYYVDHRVRELSDKVDIID